MLGTILLSIFALAIVWVIYVEYKNTQKYKKERDEKRQLRKAPPSELKAEKPPKEEKKPEPEPKSEPLEEKAVLTPKAVETEPEPEIIHEEVKVEEKPEVTAEKELPPCNYPPFDHSRMIESLGLTEEDAKEFMAELISQIETQLPLIKEEMRKADFHQLEKLTHSIKGSATNLGTGGVSDLLVDFNTYLKKGSNKEIAEYYIAALETYTEKLKAQYA
ncbi:MAG: Hpt domain-containing protein [Campylobacterales bacterium]|nr:Hpt domain-containing protein [Campylobacterales bacterium]